MEINLSHIDVVFAELSIATIEYDPSQCIDPNDYDAVCSLFPRVLGPWFVRLTPNNRQQLVSTLVYCKSADTSSIVGRVISDCPHLPFVGDVAHPETLIGALLDAFNVEVIQRGGAEWQEECSRYEVIEDQTKANELLNGILPGHAVDSEIQRQAEEVSKRFFD